LFLDIGGSLSAWQCGINPTILKGLFIRRAENSWTILLQRPIDKVEKIKKVCGSNENNDKMIQLAISVNSIGAIA